MTVITDPSPRELRMYFFVMYNLSGIQQAIQSGHCVEEYGDKYHNTELYKEYRKFKTWIILNGGTSNNGFIGDFKVNDFSASRIRRISDFDESKIGTMELYEKYLIDNNIPFAEFHEPDLNNALSALCFICDNKVFDWFNYPPFIKWVYEFKGLQLTDKEKVEKLPYESGSSLDKLYQEWVEFVGGEQNAKLKELIYGKKLA